MPLFVTEDEINRIHEAIRRVDHRVTLNNHERLLLTILEKIMALDPNVQKIADDAEAIKTTLATVLDALATANATIAQLHVAVNDAQAKGLDGVNVEALQKAANTLETAISTAQAAAAPTTTTTATDPAAPAAAASPTATDPAAATANP